MQRKPKESTMLAGAPGAHPATQLQRLLQRQGEMKTAGSLGEALVPFFLAAVEVCWFNGVLIALASVDFLHTREALLPFWGPLLLFCAALWLFQHALHKEASASEEEQSARLPAGSGLLFGVLALLAVGLIWLRIYATSYFLLDPRWLLTFIGDLLSLNEHFSLVLTIAIVTVYFCWRGSRLAQLQIEPGHVKRQIWVGLPVLLTAILMRASQSKGGGNFDDVVLVLLVPAFLYFALASHALAHTSFVRRSHPFGLDGNIATQERAMLSIIGSLGLVLLALTLIGSLFFSATFFASLQPTWQVLSTAYAWSVDKLSLALGWLLQPLFWLIDWIATFRRAPQKHSTPASNGVVRSSHQYIVQTSPAFFFISHALLPILILLGLSLAVWLSMRRRKRLRITRNRTSGDVHESVWSWKLFWHQFKTFFAALFRRGKATDVDAELTLVGDGLPAEPAARTMREIYRALLKKAASSGYVRRRNETPYEFQRRLNQLRPTNNEPQLSQLTEAYALTRYGGNIPDEFDLTSVRHSWDELAHKWDAPER